MTSPASTRCGATPHRSPDPPLDLLALDRIVPMTLDEEDALAEAQLAAAP